MTAEKAYTGDVLSFDSFTSYREHTAVANGLLEVPGSHGPSGASWLSQNPPESGKGCNEIVLVSRITLSLGNRQSKPCVGTGRHPTAINFALDAWPAAYRRPRPCSPNLIGQL